MTPKKQEKTRIEPQWKHTMITFAADAMVLVAKNPNQAIVIFNEMLNEIRRVKYYRPSIPKKPQPRVSKTPVNKWRKAKMKKINAA